MFSLGAAPALAGIADYSPETVTRKAVEKIEEMFGIRRESTKDAVSSMNVMPFKVIPPQVQIMFTPANPKPGEKVTARAVPTGFDSSLGSYFTWYISRDGKKGVKTMKNTAAKIIANGGVYDSSKENKDEWDEDWEDFEGDSDDDGYMAIYGGETSSASKDFEDTEGLRNSTPGAKHCYVHDFKTGVNHEVKCEHHFPEDLCEEDGDFSDSDEADWGTNPYDEDTDGDGVKDEADLCGFKQDTFSWHYKAGDKVGVIVEGTSSYPTKYADASYMIFWALPKNSCDLTEKTKLITEPEDLCPIDIAGLPAFIETFNAEDECLLALLSTEIESFLSDEVPSKKILGSLENITLLETDTVADIASSIIAELISDHQATYPDIVFADISNKLTNLLEDFEDGYTNEGLGSESDHGKVEYDKCLDDNLVSPTEGDAFSKMEVNLSFHPKDPLDIAGEMLNVNAFVSNTPDLDKVKFAWKFEGCADVDVCDEKISFDKIKGIGRTVGFGLTSISLPLGLELGASTKYLKVSVRASIDFDKNASNSGVGIAYIPLEEPGSDQVKIYSAEFEEGAEDEDGRVIKTINEEAGGYFERCSEGESLCPVAEGEIIWLENEETADAYTWLIDGKPFNPDVCNSVICKDILDNDGDQIGSESTNTAYFEVSKKKGGIHTIQLIASNNEEGTKTNITKKFEVIKPELKIKPQDCTGSIPNRILLGQFKQGHEITDWCTDEKKVTADYSEKEFFILEGSEIKLTGDFSLKPFGKKLIDPTWKIDGVSVKSLEDFETQEELGLTIDGCALSFVSDRAGGEQHTIEYAGYYTEKASDGTITEKFIEDKIEIKVMNKEQPKSDAVIATIFTGFPSYLLFLFKATILIALMLFVSRVVFTFIPRFKN